MGEKPYLCGSMTYQEYGNHVKVACYLGKPLSERYKKIHDLITDLWDGMEVSVDTRDHRIHFHKNGESHMFRNTLNGWLWCDHERVWSALDKTEGIEITDLRTFIKDMVDARLWIAVIPEDIEWTRTMTDKAIGPRCPVGVP